MVVRAMTIPVNADGTLPMHYDPETGRKHLADDVDEMLTSVGGVHPDLAAHETLGLAAATHGHAEGDVTSLTADLSGKAALGHNHDIAYSATGHTHAYAPTAHAHVDGDLPAGLARDSEVAAGYSPLNHTHPGGSEAFPVGAVFLSLVSTNPSTLLGYGTWSHLAGGLYLVTQTGAQTGGQQVGSATHTHSFTQPSDHAAQAHSGAAVGNHVVTQPTAAGESGHTHTYTQVPNHVHVQSVNSATTGGLSGYTPDTSTNTSATSGYSTANPTGGVATGTTAGGASHTHALSGGAVDAHSVTQPSSHAAQSHSGGAVASGTTDPPGLVVYAWQRTA